MVAHGGSATKKNRTVPPCSTTRDLTAFAPIPRNRATDEVQEHHGFKDIALLWQNTNGAKETELRNFSHIWTQIREDLWHHFGILLGGKDTNNNQ